MKGDNLTHISPINWKCLKFHYSLRGRLSKEEVIDSMLLLYY
jgi:hypothetical protein